jgi:oxalate decarboxylase
MFTSPTDKRWGAIPFQRLAEFGVLRVLGRPLRSSGDARTFDYQAGDVGFVPFAMGHYIENTGDTPLRFLEMFKSSYYADVSLNRWMALTPPELVQGTLKLDRSVMSALRKGPAPVVPV